MKILAVEFSSAQRSVAIADEAAGVRGAAAESGGRSVKAIAMVKAALDQAGLKREEIDCIAVGLGPGSYAGIRAAISLAQGWQLARNVRLVGVASVECLAVQAHQRGVRGRAWFAIDAQRGEYYFAGCRIDEMGAHLTEPLRIVPQAEIIDHIQRGEQIFGPDPVPGLKDGVKLLYPEAAALARLAATRREFMAGEQLEPIYLREAGFVKAANQRSWQ
jgi:tRNA threonylcarbamoyladenosine biosynthesis protein TsaB